MKISIALAAYGLISTVTAFIPTSTSRNQYQVSSSSSSTSLDAVPSRRDMFDATSKGVISFLLAAAVTTTTTMAVPPTIMAAHAEEPRPMYLTEPTAEFKASEAKAMEYKRAQLAVKKEFNDVLEAFLAEVNDETKLVKGLKALQGVIAKNGGLPLGVKKEELFKIIRSKKAKGYWPTPVEVAYQSLKAEISYQQSPNLDKETGNPYQ
jgi:hypothetical protein